MTYALVVATLALLTFLMTLALIEIWLTRKDLDDMRAKLAALEMRISDLDDPLGPAVSLDEYKGKISITEPKEPT